MQWPVTMRLVRLSIVKQQTYGKNNTFSIRDNTQYDLMTFFIDFFWIILLVSVWSSTNFHLFSYTEITEIESILEWILSISQTNDTWFVLRFGKCIYFINLGELRQCLLMTITGENVYFFLLRVSSIHWTSSRCRSVTVSSWNFGPSV